MECCEGLLWELGAVTGLLLGLFPSTTHCTFRSTTKLGDDLDLVQFGRKLRTIKGRNGFRIWNADSVNGLPSRDGFIFNTEVIII